MTTTSTNPANMLAGSSQSDLRIDTGTALVVGIALVAGMIYGLGFLFMRERIRQNEAERESHELLRRASDKTIAAGLVVRR